MKRTTWLRHDAQVRANDVCTQNSDTFDATPATKNTRLALNTYVTKSTQLLAAQKGAVETRRAATQQCRVCRTALRAAGKAVVKVGQLVNLPGTVMQTLSVPGSMSDGDLLAHMQALYDRVLPYKDAFEAEGLPPDVLTKLSDGITALEAARAAYAATIQDAASAEDALSQNQDLAAATILALESVAATAAPANRELLSKLKVAKRVGPRKVQPTAAASGGTTPPATTVPPSTTPAPPSPSPAQDKVS